MKRIVACAFIYLSTGLCIEKNGTYGHSRIWYIQRLGVTNKDNLYRQILFTVSILQIVLKASVRLLMEQWTRSPGYRGLFSKNYRVLSPLKFPQSIRELVSSFYSNKNYGLRKIIMDNYYDNFIMISYIFAYVKRSFWWGSD